MIPAVLSIIDSLIIPLEVVINIVLKRKRNGRTKMGELLLPLSSMIALRWEWWPYEGWIDDDALAAIVTGGSNDGLVPGLPLS